jgi:hypothetical protein
MNTLTRTQRVGLKLAQIGSAFVALGGLGDQTVQKLMPSHEAFLGVAPGAAPPAVEQLFLALLHALGFSLVAVGLGAFVLIRVMAKTDQRSLGAIVVAMVILGDGVNAYEIHRTGSPVFLAPLFFVTLTVAGVLYVLGPRRQSATTDLRGNR